MKQKKLKRIGRKILVGASSSILAGMLLMGTAGNAYAETAAEQSITPVGFEQTAEKTGMHMMHRWNSDAKAGNLAVQLGLDRQKIKQEIKSGKTMKQVLQDHGIVPGQIQKALKTAKKEVKQSRKLHKMYTDFL